MPLPDNIQDEEKILPVVEEGNTYMTLMGISGIRVPEGLLEDMFQAGNAKYGKEALDVTYRQVEWKQLSSGVWQVSVGPPA